jgi:hypothetical protein
LVPLYIKQKVAGETSLQRSSQFGAHGTNPPQEQKGLKANAEEVSQKASKA